MSATSLYVGDTNPPVTNTITVFDSTLPNGQPANLTNATATFSMRLETSSTIALTADADILSPTLGQVQYQWQPGDTSTAGDYAAWFTVTFQDGSVQTPPEFPVRILAHAPLTGAYTTVDAVREYLSKQDGETAQDELIADLIQRYSAAVDDYTQQSFAWQPSTTLRFKFSGDVCSFSKYGLSAVTSLILSPEDTATTLDPDTDYFLLPFNKENGTWTSARLSRFLVPSYATYARVGLVMLDVTGDWGLQTVPSAVEFAVVRAVAYTVKRDIAFRTALGDDTSEPQPVFLTADVRAALQPFRAYHY